MEDKKYETIVRSLVDELNSAFNDKFRLANYEKRGNNVKFNLRYDLKKDIHYILLNITEDDINVGNIKFEYSGMGEANNAWQQFYKVILKYIIAIEDLVYKDSHGFTHTIKSLKTLYGGG